MRGNRGARQLQDNQGKRGWFQEGTAVGKLKWVQKIGEQMDSSERGRAERKTLNRENGAKQNK